MTTNNSEASDWDKDCMEIWHTVLTGEKKHWCPDWDDMPIDETVEEFNHCTCHNTTDSLSDLEKASEAYLKSLLDQRRLLKDKKVLLQTAGEHIHQMLEILKPHISDTEDLPLPFEPTDQ